MVLESILGLVRDLLVTAFAILPNVPDFDIQVLEDLESYIDLIFDNLGLLGFFIDISTIKIIVPLLVIVINFEHLYHFVMWVLKKIPFLGIE